MHFWKISTFDHAWCKLLGVPTNSIYRQVLSLVCRQHINRVVKYYNPMFGPMARIHNTSFSFEGNIVPNVVLSPKAET